MTEAIQSANLVTSRNPHLILNAADLVHLEALAEGMMRRHPTLADRLFEEIGRAQIVEDQQMPYRDETTGQEKSVTLVYPEDADITRSQVSVITPIGVALLGLSEGASFYWDMRRENQRRMLTILKVE